MSIQSTSPRSPRSWATVGLAASALTIGGLGYQALHHGAAGSATSSTRTTSSSAAATQATVVQSTNQTAVAATGPS